MMLLDVGATPYLEYSYSLVLFPRLKEETSFSMLSSSYLFLLNPKGMYGISETCNVPEISVISFLAS